MVSPSIITKLTKQVKAVVENPHNHYTKAQALALVQRVRFLADNGDKIAQYQFATLFPENSEPYLTWMHASAQQGFTNAMLALSRFYAANETSIQQAAQYLVKILSSQDSYMKAEAEELMKNNPLLQTAVQRQMIQEITSVMLALGKSCAEIGAVSGLELAIESIDEIIKSISSDIKSESKASKSGHQSLNPTSVGKSIHSLFAHASKPQETEQPDLNSVPPVA